MQNNSGETQLISYQCNLHKKVCQFFCSYSKCAKNLICKKCWHQHLQIHPPHFIYSLDNLSEIHSFNKINKLKEMLIAQKTNQEKIIAQTYKDFDAILDPLVKSMSSFNKQSRTLIEKELKIYLLQNKALIDTTQREVKKTDTQLVKNNPVIMLQETIAEAEIINRRESSMIENSERYKFYCQTTKEMCKRIATQVSSMVEVSVSLIQNSIKLQRNSYSTKEIVFDRHAELPFSKKFFDGNSGNNPARIKLEQQVMQVRQTLDYKDSEIMKTKKEVRDKKIKIEELLERIDELNDEISKIKQKFIKEEEIRILNLQNERKKRKEILIRDEIIGTNKNSLCFERKLISPNYLPLILDIVPQPIELDLTNHRLTSQNLQLFLNCNAIEIFKYNFTTCDEQFLKKALKSFITVVHLELNSIDLSSKMISQFANFMPSRVQHLQIMDNKINDIGLEQILINMPLIEELLVSFNKLTHFSIIIIHKKCPNIRKLHISKNNLGKQGATLIGEHLPDLEELYVGGTGMTKQGLIIIYRKCQNIKKLSLVSNEAVNEVLTELLLGLPSLQWLDISYCNSTQSDLEIISKLRTFNKNLKIIGI